MKSNLLLASCLALAVSPAHAQSPMALAKKMVADYQSATLKKDFANFEKSSTKDFVYIDGKGKKTTKAQAMAGLKGFYGPMAIKSVKVQALSAKMAEGGLVFVQEERIVGSMKMGGPKPSLFESHTKDEVLVVKQGGAWKTKRVKNLFMEDKVDGKPMPGM